ncbi:MAG: hypothetical protein Q8Q30_00285 [Candidatus Woesebacteria bacterium]|nr:hypothetical protein [Candidatus Woesebacteria bacterium]
MSYLSFIIALIQFLNQDTARLSMFQGLDRYLDMVVGWELFFLKLSIGGFVVALIIFLALLALDKDLAGCGCYLLVLGVFWPILEVITYFIAKGLASSVTTEAIVDPTKFWLLVILMALLGAG